MNLRKVQIFHGSTIYEAWFHLWTDTSSEQYMQALIEHMTGEISLVPFYSVKFLESPENVK